MTATVQDSFVPLLGARAGFFAVPRAEVVYVKLAIESFEGIAIARSMDPEPNVAVVEVAVLATDDTFEAAGALVDVLMGEGVLTPLPPGPERVDALLTALGGS